jgi:D-hydroxyproline dehydrogenase subunit gamma
MTSFRTLPGITTVRLTIDGRMVEAPEGASVAAALLLAGHAAFGRHPITGEPEGPWCLIGVCFGCLVEIDGIADRQACLVPARAGMTVRTRLSED